jgi:hypothetical protein
VILAGLFSNKWVWRLVLGVLTPMALGYGWYVYNYPTCTFRFKLTAKVMTPDGSTTGSSVIEVSYSHNADWGGGESPDLNMTGEAVYVDLKEGKNLFVTLTSHESGREVNLDRNYSPLEGALDAYAIPLKVFGLRWSFGRERAMCAAFSLVPLDQRLPVLTENMPTLVSFGNLSDPNSVKVVQPDKISDVLGDGYKLQNVWLEVTDEKPNNTGMKIFPWWETKTKEWESKWIFSIDDKLIDRLYYSAFKQPTIVGKAK